MSPRSKEKIRPVPRALRGVPCLRGMCMGRTGEFTDVCPPKSEANDHSYPPSELTCSRLLEKSEAIHSDEYIREYIEVCRMIDEMIANPDLTPDLIQNRLEFIKEKLDMLQDVYIDQEDEGMPQRVMTFAFVKDRAPRITEEVDPYRPEDWGNEPAHPSEKRREGLDLLEGERLSYHISARLLDAAMGCFGHRALFKERPLSPTMMEATKLSYMRIYEDFEPGGLYERFLDHPGVAQRLGQCVVFSFLSRDPETFPHPALYRESSGAISELNRDGLIFQTPPAHIITPIRISNSEYKKQKTKDLPDRTIDIVWQYLASFGSVNSEPVVQHVLPQEAPETFDTSEDIYDKYAVFDPDHTEPHHAATTSYQDTVEDEEAFTYVSMMSATDYTDLMRVLKKEAHRQELSKHETLLITGMTHYLRAIVRHVS